MLLLTNFVRDKSISRNIACNITIDVSDVKSAQDADGFPVSSQVSQLEGQV
jgi:hypothetical protein